jgi:predicted phosphoribosyltransferase
MGARYPDRFAAGRFLARQLRGYVDRPDVLVLALPRGGVPVAFEVARALRAPLDVFVVRKLGVPGHQELAFGAISTGGVRVIHPDMVDAFELSEDSIDAIVDQEERELARREHRYRRGRPLPRIHGKTVILVDDGLATGASMKAAVVAVREHEPSRLVVAVPIASMRTCESLAADVDEMICGLTPEPFLAVGQWYDDFGQTQDEEVNGLLARAAEERTSSVDGRESSVESFAR